MLHAVVRKQENSKLCLVCGLKNPFGLHAAFYELENGELVCQFKPSEMHQSYPGRTHGGITTALLDETIGRAILMRYDHALWGVTIEFTAKFRKPVPLDQELRVVGRITSENSRLFEGTGEVYLPDGDVAATGSGKYLKLPISKIADFDEVEQEWRVNTTPSDPMSIDLGDLGLPGEVQRG
ncbi:MAG: PaaI family thioesterase [Ignavibacteriales bacterium]|nr:PaaI family thioesterase [Ignavibacteriales bacterium]